MSRPTRAATALAHPNIALVKYWGKEDEVLNTPAVESVSITLDTFATNTTVTFDPGLPADELVLNGEPAGDAERDRVSAFLDLLRRSAGVDEPARVVSDNNFPTAAGLASSASGFAALAVAADGALGLGHDRRRLSALARQGSGSAARSLYGGFVHMSKARAGDASTACASQVMRADRWPLSVVVALTSRDRKTHLSTSGMNLTRDTSPFYSAWISSSANDVATARQAIELRDFEALATVSEYSCLKMHGLMLSARPGLVYWNGATVDAIQTVRTLRAAGTPVFFTIDAGPQLKAVCEPSALDQVAGALADVPGVVDVLRLGLGGDAHIVS